MSSLRVSHQPVNYSRQRWEAWKFVLPLAYAVNLFVFFFRFHEPIPAVIPRPFLKVSSREPLSVHVHRKIWRDEREHVCCSIWILIYTHVAKVLLIHLFDNIPHLSAKNILLLRSYSHSYSLFWSTPASKFSYRSLVRFFFSGEGKIIKLSNVNCTFTNKSSGNLFAEQHCRWKNSWTSCYSNYFFLFFFFSCASQKSNAKFILNATTRSKRAEKKKLKFVFFFTSSRATKLLCLDENFKIFIPLVVVIKRKEKKPKNFWWDSRLKLIHQN